MSQSFCTICRARIPNGSRCSSHRTVSPSSRSWHSPGAGRLHQQILERDNHRCVLCGSELNLEVHHRIPAEDGGPMEAWNLETRCWQCHRRPTTSGTSSEGVRGAPGDSFSDITTERT